MKKFITFEEKILKNISIEEYINYLSSRGVVGIEIAMHDNLLDFKSYELLAKEASNKSIAMNYHIADFVLEGEYDISCIRNEANVKKNFTNFYDKILKLLNYTSVNSNTLITFHGAKTYNNNYIKAYDDTLYFCDWSLNMFEKRNMPFAIACESLNSSTKSFGDSRLDLLKLVLQFETEKLGLCWDIVHDYNNFKRDYQMPDDLFYKYIQNIHIHGTKLSNGIIDDHLPLHESDLNLDTFINYLKKHNYKSPITHELLDFRCKDYIKDLNLDLDILEEYF